MKFVFLVYYSRSGSTYLANLLSKNCRDLIVLPETDLVTTLANTPDAKLRSMSPSTLANLISSDAKIGDWELPNHFFDSVAEAACGGGTEEILTKLASQYAEHLGCAPPKAAMFQRGTILNHHHKIRQAISSPSFLYIYRDPRAAINSIASLAKQTFSNFQRSKMGRHDVIGLAYAWRKYHRLAMSVAEDRSVGTVIVRYQELCRIPDETISRVLDDLKLKRSAIAEVDSSVVSGTDQEIHRNINRSPDLSRLNGWQSEMAPVAGRIVEKILSPELRSLDLEPFFKKQPVNWLAEVSDLTCHRLAYFFAELQRLARRLKAKTTGR